MSVRPFENLKKQPGRRRFASTTYVERRLHETLGSFHITSGNGLKVSAQSDGQVHFEQGSAECIFPFQAVVRGLSNGFGLGVVYGHVRLEGGAPMVPRMQGKPLDDAEPPAISLPVFTGTRHLIMQLRWLPVVGSLAGSSNVTIKHLAGATLMEPPVITLVSAIPQQIRPQVNWPEGTVTREGTEYVTLATLVSAGGTSGVTLTQGWWGHMSLWVDGAGYLLYNIGG